MPHTPPTRRLPTWAAYTAAPLAGLALLVSFPPYGLWPAAVAAVTLLALACRGRRLRAGLALGALTGATCFIPLLSWTGTQVGWWPWILLASLQAAYVALLGAAAAWTTVLADRWRWTWAPLTAVLWVAQEALRDTTPFGGFPWGRLAFSQADAPTLRYASLGGAPLVTFAVALAGGLLAAACWHTSRRSVIPAAGALAVLAGGLLVPAAAGDGRTVTIAYIQGNVPRLGLEFNAQRQAVLNNHADATLKLADDLAGKPKPDLVVWPENSSDIDPFHDQAAADRIEEAAAAIGAPILVGAVLQGPGDGASNTGLLWIAGQGPVQRYVKQHPVPFAEYVPMRSFVRHITTKVDLVRTDFVAGDRIGSIDVPNTAGAFRIGDVICFEVAYDHLVRSTATAGAQLLVVQTNNATFNPAEATQQLAMVRLRAVEHGRPALMASTVGVSAFVSADGTVHAASAFNTRAIMTRQVRLASTKTLATRLGAAPELALTGLALIGLAAAAIARRRGRVAPRHMDMEEA